MKFQIGDVVHLEDGIDYNGDSLTYEEGFDVEIIGYEENKYRIRDFWRSVEEDEIQKLVMSNSEKCKKYVDKLSLQHNQVVIRTGSLTFKEVTIQYYGFRYYDFMYLENKEYWRVGKFWLTLQDAYKECYEVLVGRMQEIHKQAGTCFFEDRYPDNRVAGND